MSTRVKQPSSADKQTAAGKKYSPRADAFPALLTLKSSSNPDHAPDYNCASSSAPTGRKAGGAGDERPQRR